MLVERNDVKKDGTEGWASASLYASPPQGKSKKEQTILYAGDVSGLL